jgi:L-ascorbate metabolism protein UlaG (beta-lactamase superfamily)
MSRATRSVILLIYGLLVGCSRKDSPPPKPTENTANEVRSNGTASAAVAANPGAASGDTFATSKGPLVITPIRHASLLLTFDKKAIYVDPTAEGKYDGLPKADYIFLTHSHPDHLDKAQIEALKLPTTEILGPPDVTSNFDSATALKNGDKKSFGAFEVEAVPSYNIVRGPGPGKLYHPKGQWDGFVFTFGDKRVYISGDTECIPEMKALRNIDIAFVCMRLPYTMPPAEAAECIKAFRPKILYPYHYQTSNLDELSQALKDEKGIEIRRREWYPSK